jgi:ribosome maturation factor RimP
MNSIKHKIAEMIPSHLFFLDLVEDQSNSKIKIIVDGTEPIDLKTTTSIAREVRSSEIFNNVYPNGVHLEVTSPGIETPLLYPFQYEKNLGRTLKIISLFEDKVTKLVLTLVNDSYFEGLSDSGKKIQFKYNQIKSAIIDVKF